MKITAVSILLFISLALCGCEKSIELEDRALITAIGIDKEDTAFKISAKLSEENNKLVGISESADGIFSTDSIKKPYPALAKVCIFGSDILKDKKMFSEITDYLEENPEVSRKTILVCTEGRAESIIDKMETGNEIYRYYEINSLAYSFYLENLIQDMLCGNSSAIPLIGDSFIPSGAVVIKDGEYLSETDSDTLDGLIILSGKHNSYDVDMKISEDSQNINLKVYIDGTEKTEENIRKAFSYMLENNADIGISEFVRKNNYDLFEKYSQDRENILQNCRLEISLKVKNTLRQ